MFAECCYCDSELSCLLPVIGWTSSHEIQLTNHRQQTLNIVNWHKTVPTFQKYRCQTPIFTCAGFGDLPAARGREDHLQPEPRHPEGEEGGRGQLHLPGLQRGGPDGVPAPAPGHHVWVDWKLNIKYPLNCVYLLFSQTDLSHGTETDLRSFWERDSPHFLHCRLQSQSWLLLLDFEHNCR